MLAQTRALFVVIGFDKVVRWEQNGVFRFFVFGEQFSDLIYVDATEFSAQFVVCLPLVFGQVLDVLDRTNHVFFVQIA